MDSLDQHIFDLLMKDGRQSYKEIGRLLDVSDGTVRTRVANMIESGEVRISAAYNPFARSSGQMGALIGMQLETRTHRKTMEQISNLDGVVSVFNVAGSYDLMAEVLLPSREALNKFLFESLAQITEVRATETFVLLDAINKWMVTSPFEE